MVKPMKPLPPMVASIGIVSPYILFDSSADNSIVCIERLTYSIESLMGLPVSFVINSAKFSRWLSNSLLILNKIS